MVAFGDYGGVLPGDALICLCQNGCMDCGNSQQLQRIVRPFLSSEIWGDATKTFDGRGCVLPAERVEASILWLDIADFTALLDSHPLEQVVVDLNAYLDTLTQVVYRHQGHVSKYLGDGFLAIFPDVDDAVQAGHALQETVADFNRRQSSQGSLIFPTRIGIDTGQVALVSLGSLDRQDRTVIGMPVNLSQRLQERAPAGGLWISQATFDRLQDQTGYCSLGPISVKGRQEPVVVYEAQCKSASPRQSGSRRPRGTPRNRS